MTLGVFIKASNAIYFRKKLDFFFEFVPQLVFMVGLFGYMDFLIVYKWLKAWSLYDQYAPSIITTMINLPLNVGKTVTINICRPIAVVGSQCGGLMNIHPKIQFKCFY